MAGEVPEEFGFNNNLIQLRLNDNRLTGEVPDSFTLLENIEVLKLEFNQFASDPHWLVEFIPEECEFNADEDDICACPSSCTVM